MPLSRSALLAFLLFFSGSMWAQTTRSAPELAKDPKAVAVVEAAIRALGGTAAIRQAKRWAFQGQTEGSGNAPRSETLASGVARPASPPASGGSPQKLPSWARPRSSFIPALVGSLLVQQLQGNQFSIELQNSPPGAEGVAVVVFSIRLDQDRRIPAQVWHIDATTNLPRWVWFIQPVKVGEMESPMGAGVLLSDYRSVGGVMYPYRIEMDDRRTGQREVIALQSVSPSTTTGGAQ